MFESGKFVYTKLSDTTAALGTGNRSVDGNGFVEKTKIKGVVKVPSYFGSLRVVSILEYATRNCNLITKIILPNTITTLESAALTMMTKIKEVIFPASIITIKNNNDYYVNAEKISFEKGSRVTSIGNNFIRYSKVVKEIILPSSIQSIGSYFADNCISLERVSFCGSTDLSSIVKALNACSYVATVFVSYEYVGKSFGGKAITTKDFYNCFPLHDNCKTIKYQRCYKISKITI